MSDSISTPLGANETASEKYVPELDADGVPVGLYTPSPWPTKNERGYEIPEDVMGKPQKLKIVAIGAGISGICLAHAVSTVLENVELSIYEMGGGYGGTWFWNKYPGCRCDVPSINYQLSFEPNPDWDEFYSTGPEFQRYYDGIVAKYGLAKYFSLNTTCIRAEWDDATKLWTLTLRDNATGREFTDSGNVFINAGGVLNNWKWPSAIKGLHSFKGDLVHTARWDDSVTYKDKRVAVIGSGSSGIQVLATMQPDVAHMYHWIRSPTWITGAFAKTFAGPDGANFKYTAEHKARFRADPVHSLKYRKMIESELNERFKFVVQGTPEQKDALKYGYLDMCARLNYDKRLIDAIVPKTFPVGCRRPTPGNGYLEALTQPNVTVYTEMFKEITPSGFIAADGSSVDVDVIVCATGFDTSFVPAFPIIAYGQNLQDRWAEYPTDGYLSYAVKDLPNYFSYYGPHGPTGHGSGAPMIEAYTKCFVTFIKKMQIERITSMKPSARACADFNEHRELYLKRTAWAQKCASWFKPNNDVAPVLFPGNRVLFIEMLYNPRFEDFDYEYSQAGNRFGYWGNGFTQRELDGRDTTFYYGLLDGKDEQPDYSDVRALYVGLK